MALNILDPLALPEELDLLDEYGLGELSHYGDDKFDIFNGDESRQKADLNPIVVPAERNSFIRMMFQRGKLYQRSIDLKLTKESDKVESRKGYKREEKLRTV